MRSDDMDLVREFADGNSEAAFASLVQKHINLVYSAALRQLGNPADAEEVTQAVFVILARKAPALHPGTVLSGWLYQTARLASGNFRRAALRRQRREQEAAMQLIEDSQLDHSWQRLSPLLEEGMAALGQQERDALVLRFFENRTVREVAAALDVQEAAAQKRVNRATEKLRQYFIRRGVHVSVAVLLASIGTNAVQAAPVGLAAKIAAAGTLTGLAAGGSTFTLINSTLKIMAWTKAKTALAVGAGMLLAAGTATVTVKQIAHHRAESVWDHITRNDGDQLRSAPPAVSVRLTKFDPSVRGWHTVNGKILGLGQPFNVMLACAYNISQYRVVLPAQPPPGDYDYIASVADHQREALQQAIRENYGISARREVRETDVLVLTLRQASASGLKRTTTKAGSKTYNVTSGNGEVAASNIAAAELASILENYLKIPVLDKTGLAGRFDVNLRWPDRNPRDHAPEALKQAVREQLGLEFAPARQPVELLVATK